MSGPTLIITGAGGGSPNRLEINDFVSNDKFFSLYIQALQMMYDKDFQQDVSSFFQVGGIHGLPYVTWNGATGTPSDNSNQWEGYCFHGSVLFPTWHRPYMMLYEQILQQCAETIAATYTVDTADWTSAATQLRQPYWDWAQNSVPPPQVITDQQVTITASNGEQVSVPNPLYHYTFNPNGALQALGASPPFNAWPITHRHPFSNDPNTTDNTDELISFLTNQQSSITTNTYNMLTRLHDWPDFSNHTVTTPGQANNSLESIHDNIHVQVGWGGHMTDPSVAALDPIFYLHHANVDRMLSLWAALNYTVWVTEGDSEGGSYTQPADTPVDGNSNLTPFWNSNTTFWVSNVQVTSQLGYTYPEFNGLDMGNPEAVQTAIGNIVNNLYGAQMLSRWKQPASAAPSEAFAAFAVPPAAPPAAVTASVLPPATQQHPAAAQGGQSKVGHGLTPAHPHPIEHEVWDWTARVEFKKYELKTSFSVLIFVGPVPANPKDWLTSPNLAGTHSAFVNSAAKSCSNCVKQADLVEEGFVHLDHAIMKHSGLTSLDPKVVAPYLKENLHWRVLKTDGSPAELASLEVAVIATLLTLPVGTQFPHPEKVIRHNHITYGRKGGSRHA